MSEEAQVYPVDNSEEVLTGEAASFGEQKLNITVCGACDNRHEGIQVHEYARAPKPFTHWYRCPNTQDPVPVSLVMMKTGGAMELRGPICQALAKAQVAGRYLAAIFYIEEGVLRLSFTEEKFPPGDYFETKERKGIMGMLREIFERNVGAIAPQEMKTANMPKALRDLLGNGQPASDRTQYHVPREVGEKIVQEFKEQSSPAAPQE